MAPPAAEVLFVDADDAMEPARLAVARRGVGVRAVRYSGGEAALAGPAPTVAVIGPGVPSPAAAARKLCAAYPLLHIVFAVDEDKQEEARRTLLYSAPANTPWKIVVPDAGAVTEAVATSLEAARRSVQVRTTLDRVNLRLAANAPPDALDYRRLVVSDHYLASVLKHVQDAIISLDLRGQVLSWNDGAMRLFGVSAREAFGRDLGEVVGAAADLRELAAAAMREGSVRTELRFRVGGREVLADATFSAVEDRPAQVIAVAVILRDITDRVRTEKALAHSEALFRALADNIPQLAWMAGRDGGIFWYNKRWFEYTGSTLEVMAGWGWKAVHHPDHVERVAEKFAAHIATGVPWEDTFPLRSRHGEYRWFLSRAFPIPDAAGAVQCWFGTNTDITEERAAQEALREVDRRKDEFISVLSHELRNPLAPIRSSIFLLERVGHDEEAAKRARQVISRQTEHLTRLVDDLLDVTRIARGRIELARTKADLAAVIRSTSEDYRAVIEAQGVTLRVDVPSAPVWADVDAARIGQVLGNLLHNAVKFTPAGGSIEVRLEREAECARVDVRDTGVGIESALMPTIFDPFVQAERSLVRSKGGLGLGLALARGIVEMHGGRISADSAGVDQGATFTLWLPASTKDAAYATPGESQDVPPPARARQVLVVDDNRDAADSLARLVSLFGHKAHTAYDGPSALVSARSLRPDIVLCDIGLPGMDGYEVARRLLAELKPLRIYAVTGYAQPADRERAADAGFEGHVAKPPKPEEIRRLLQ